MLFQHREQSDLSRLVVAWLDTFHFHLTKDCGLWVGLTQVTVVDYSLGIKNKEYDTCQDQEMCMLFPQAVDMAI